jgi:hypothetical protein
MNQSKLDLIINIIREEMAGGGLPVSNVSGGNIAGTPAADPGNPPVHKKRKKNVIFLGPKSRTAWVRNIRQK